VAVIVIVASQPGTQLGVVLVTLVICTFVAGCIIVTVVTAVQPLASVPVIVYVLAGKPEKVRLPLCVPMLGDIVQLVLFIGAVPPVPVTTITPVLSPRQSTWVVLVTLKAKTAG